MDYDAVTEKVARAICLAEGRDPNRDCDPDGFMEEPHIKWMDYTPQAEAAIEAAGVIEPIDTAPRDGTPILCWNAFFGWYNSAYVDGEFPCGFSGRCGAWYPKPTHWMPLPKPPTHTP